MIERERERERACVSGGREREIYFFESPFPLLSSLILFCERFFNFFNKATFDITYTHSRPHTHKHTNTHAPFLLSDDSSISLPFSLSDTPRCPSISLSHTHSLFLSFSLSLSLSLSQGTFSVSYAIACTHALCLFC